MRWLYHLIDSQTVLDGERYAPESLAREGFVHCSYRDAVRESARLHFPPGARLDVLRLDPRRIGAPIEEARMPRGPMPHVLGAIPRAAIAERLPLDAIDLAPDAIE